MTPESDDPLLDACLDEVLGGHAPPDLTPRIMRAWAAHGPAPEAGKAWEALAIAPEPPPILVGLQERLNGCEIRPAVELRREALVVQRRKNQTKWITIALSVGIVAVGLAIGIIPLVKSQRSPLTKKLDGNGPKSIASAPSLPVLNPAPPTPTGPPLVAPSIVSAGPELARRELPTDSVAPMPTTNDSSAQSKLVDAANPPAAASKSVEKRYLRPSPDAEIVSFVNSELTRNWQAAGVKPAPPVTDSEWCQRLFIRLLGRAATPEELKTFVDDKNAQRRNKLVEQLLTGSKYADEFAQHWSAALCSMLLGRANGPNGSLASREELEKYLREALIADKPYSQIVLELLTATGSAKPGASDYNPAVNFLLDGLNSTATVATSRVARVFLGRQLQCAQCHEQPSQGSSQEQFWALNSFFRQMRMDRSDGGARLVNVDFSGQGRGSSGGEVFYETPDGLLKTAFPRFIDGTEIPVSGELAKVNRRHELARLVVQSDELPKAFVNRMWAHFFDYGFMVPVDGLRPNSSPSAPALFERLAAEFAAHDYDLKSLIRWTVLSDPFTRSSKLADLTSEDMPEEGGAALFSRYYARPAKSAAVFNSLVQAVRIRKTTAGGKEREQARIDWLAQANRSATKLGSSEPASSALMIRDGDVVSKVGSNSRAALLEKLAGSSMPFDKKVEHLFLAAVAREPTRREQRAANDVLASVEANQTAALEDIWWALCNSSECVLGH
jgi:hypothetical protein